MIIFGASVSPFVRKAIAFANEKGLDFEHKPLPPHNDDPDFQTASPIGRIPAMKDGEYSVADSSAIIQYLEAKHAEPALMGKTAEERGNVVFFDKYADTVLIANAMGPIFFNRVAYRFFGAEPNEAAAVEAETEKLPEIMTFLESVLGDGREWLVGDSISLADVSVASPFKNMEYGQAKIDWSAYPKTQAFVDRVLGRDSFAELLAMDKAMMGG